MSLALRHVLLTAVVVFASAFIGQLLYSGGAVTLKAITAAGAAGLSALLHWADTQLANKGPANLPPHQ